MFRGRLALSLHCTLDELARRLSVKELKFWRLFDAIYPIGAFRTDHLAAMICRTIARMAGVTVDGDAYEPRWGQSLIDQSPDEAIEMAIKQQDEIKSAFKAIFATKPPV